METLLKLGYNQLAGEWVKTEIPTAYGVHFNYEKIKTTPDCPAIYIWVANGKLIYVGETGVGVNKRLRKHRESFRSDHANGKTGRKNQQILLDTGAERIQVYYATSPLFYNSIVPSEYILSDMNKGTRMIEESLIIRHFKPIINQQ